MKAPFIGFADHTKILEDLDRGKPVKQFIGWWSDRPGQCVTVEEVQR